MARLFDAASVMTCGTAGGVDAASVWSACAWANLTDAAVNRTIVAKRSGFSVGTNQFEFGIQVTTAKLQISFNATAVVTNSTMSTGTLQHVGVTASSAGVIGYINGSGSAQVNGVCTSGTNTNQALDVGGLSYASAQYWKGTLAEIAVWNTVLTADDFAMLAKGYSPLNVRRRNLRHYWPLIGRGASTEVDVRGQQSATVVAGTTNAPHPRIIMAKRSRIILSPPPLTQRHYRFRTDAGAVDDTPTWGAAEDANGFDPGTSNFRLRFSVANTGSGSVSAQPFELYLSKNSGAYAPITTTSTGGVKSADASSDADNTVIKVPRLTPGA